MTDTLQLGLVCTEKPVLSVHSKKKKKSFQDQLSLNAGQRGAFCSTFDLHFNAGQKYCRILQGERSAVLSTFIKLLFVFKIFVLSIFEWPLKTSYTVQQQC